jgi:glycosyltransferase involved in cell wall biosynthesis
MVLPEVSVVVPVYNEGESLHECYSKLSQVMQQSGVTYELLFINDGSLDESKAILSAKADQDSCVRVINFSRNFGHQIAITAGMDYAKGNAVVLIDADLQDPPELILEMIALWRKGYDVVYARRLKRKGETWFKKTTAKLFYRILNKLSSVHIPMDVGDFRLVDRKVVEALKDVRESNRFVRGLISWVGYHQIAVDYVREPRFAGETKYPFSKMLGFALNAIISFSYKPLRLATYLGFTSGVVGAIYLLSIVIQKMFTDRLVPGWASLMGVIILYNGIILFILGIIGEYIGRIFTQCKQRPLYIVESIISSDQQGSEHTR